jgi:hypothetical protein
MSGPDFWQELVGAADWFVSGQFAVDIANEFASHAIESSAKETSISHERINISSSTFGFLKLVYPGSMHKTYTNDLWFALQGDYSPSDGSWSRIVTINDRAEYKFDPSVRRIKVSSNEAKNFMYSTQEQATVMCDMLDKLKSKLGESDDGHYPPEDYGILPSLDIYKRNIKDNFSTGFTTNSNSLLALLGDPLRDGSWCMYDESKTILHTLSSDLVNYFLDATHYASVAVCSMLDKMREAGVIGIDINQANAPSQQAEITVDTSPTIDFRESPTFLPSAASPATRFCEPQEYCLLSIRSSLVDSSAIQSFYEALPLHLSIGSSNYPRSVLEESLVINDEILHIPPFDESLYCKLVIENHKYSLAELYDDRHAASEAKAKRWMKYGILAGIATLNPLMPFFLSNQGRINADKGTKLEELIPDPHLMFLQDEYSFSRMIHGGVGVPQMRRLIIHPVVDGDHLSYRVLPAALTQNFVIPLQIFSFKNFRFLRPICAGIDPVQPNYNAKRLHKLYYHLRADGRQEDTGERINVCGVDIDLERYKLYKFTSNSKELEYYYIDYPTEPGHVF